MCEVKAHANFNGHELNDITVINPGGWFGKTWLIEIGGSYSPHYLIVEADSMSDAIDELADEGALDKLAESSENAAKFLRQHQLGIWGDVCGDDAEANEQALEHGDRILSVYHTAKGQKLYVITEADRSSTCILLPEEY